MKQSREDSVLFSSIFLTVILFFITGCGGGETTSPSCKGTCDDPPTIQGLTENQKAIVEELSEVCSGVGKENASLLTGESRIHPIVLVDSSGNLNEWTEFMPSEWWPGSADDTELVVCLNDEEPVLLQTCTYFGSDVKRYQYQKEIRLVKARTGKSVGTFTMYGTLPRECRGTESSDLTTLTGDNINFGVFQNWMSSFFNHPFSTVPSSSIDVSGNIFDLSFNGSHFWIVSNLDFIKLSNSGKEISRFDSPEKSFPQAVAHEGDNLWAATSNGPDGTIYKLDDAGNVLSSFASPSNWITHMDYDGEYLWIVDGLNTVYKVDTSGNIILTFDSPAQTTGGISFDGTYLFIADNFFYNRIMYQTDTSGNTITSFEYTGGKGIDFNGELWNYHDGKIHKYSVDD